jgi:hypothetical protein
VLERRSCRRAELKMPATRSVSLTDAEIQNLLNAREMKEVDYEDQNQ